MSRACSLTAIAGLLVCLPSVSQGAPPVLRLPATGQRVDVAVAAPKGFRPGEQAWKLVDVDRPEVSVPVQVAPAIASDGSAAKDSFCLLADIPAPANGAPAKPAERRFRLEPAGTTPACKGGMQWRDAGDKSLGAWDGDKPVLVYNHGVITNEALPVTELRRSRACFVHPLFGLHGEVLTDSFPKDHYHHHGVFWAWPHVQIEGQEYDLWTYRVLKPKFVAWLARQEGPKAAVLGVENGWFIGDRKVMAERVWLRPYKAADGKRALDVTLVLIPQVKLTLWGAPMKSYGGLNLRFAPRPPKETMITVPSGLTKEDLPDTHLPWADLTATFAGAPGPTGAAVFVAPQHPDFPPTWLTRHYGVLCVGWPGVKPKTFEPGTPVRLDYRILVHDGVLPTDVLAGAYADYTATTQGKWEAAKSEK